MKSHHFPTSIFFTLFFLTFHTVADKSFVKYLLNSFPTVSSTDSADFSSSCSTLGARRQTEQQPRRKSENKSSENFLSSDDILHFLIWCVNNFDDSDFSFLLITTQHPPSSVARPNTFFVIGFWFSDGEPFDKCWTFWTLQIILNGGSWRCQIGEWLIREILKSMLGWKSWKRAMMDKTQTRTDFGINKKGQTIW